ncbi:MAG TPA: PQQ-binding-like beta-propeller repeat protein [Candidatus Limnocylindrales bacterium]|nr:PQQ-binding-like beta-propeller repeat protein [Candidatus Limnocylindrales bacterium]
MKRLSHLLLLANLLSFAALAENWPQWRGPFFNGSTSESNLPTQWSKTENVTWVTPLPGYSGATPVVWEDSVFVSSPDGEKNLLLLCIDRKTGKVRWQQIVSDGNQEKGRNNMASPSPVTDGHNVFLLVGTGKLAAFDFSGKELWRRDLAKDYGRFSINWLYGSSPLLYRNKLYVEVLQANPPDYPQARDDKPERESFLLCLDPATGKNLWRHARRTDAISEAQEAYTTPIPCQKDNHSEIIVVGGDYITAHDPDKGDELWRCAGLNDRHEMFWRIVPSPVVAAGLIIACGPKRDPVLAIRDGGHGMVTATHMAWKSKEFSADCVTPLFYQNKLFVLDGDKQIMTCLEPTSGTKKWQGNLGVRDIFRASPTGADGKVYCLSEAGTVVVLSAGDEFNIISTISMGEAPVRSSIAAAQGELFIRTAQNLYCIGRK